MVLQKGSTNSGAGGGGEVGAGAGRAQHAGVDKKCGPDGLKALGEKKYVFKLNYCLVFFPASTSSLHLERIIQLM